MSTGLWEAWAQTVVENPSLPALINSLDGKCISRNELNILSEKLASDFGPLQGPVVALAEPNGPGWFAAFLAVQKLGGTVLPLDPGLSPALRVATARALGASFLFDSGRLIPLIVPGGEAFSGSEDVCLLKLTSGTTAKPRSLPFTSAQMVADGRQVCTGMNIDPRDLNFGAIPFGHSYGLGNLVLPLLIQGTPVAFSTETLPGALAEGIQRTGATVWPTVPAVLRGFSESSVVKDEQLTSLRLIISAGAFLRHDVATRFYLKFRSVPHSFYGSSETGGICFDAEGGATLEGRSVGRPLPGVEVMLDTASESRVRVTSPAVAAPGVHLLADRGEWTATGELRLLGRSAGQIANVGGRKVDPASIEQVLRELPGVTDAWVGVRTRAGGDDYLVAMVETPLPREEVLVRLRARLVSWQVPRRLSTSPHLPRSERGKLDRASLEAQFR